MHWIPLFGHLIGSTVDVSSDVYKLAPHHSTHMQHMHTHTNPTHLHIWHMHMFSHPFTHSCSSGATHKHSPATTVCTVLCGTPTLCACSSCWRYEEHYSEAQARLGFPADTRAQQPTWGYKSMIRFWRDRVYVKEDGRDPQVEVKAKENISAVGFVAKSAGLSERQFQQ
jgi:hypothetical protein